MTPLQLANAYGIKAPIDFGEHRGQGFLFSVGAGLMMSTMDELPSCRWAVDISGAQKLGPSYWVGEFCEALPHIVSHVVVRGWFTITRPDVVERDMLRRMPRERVITCSNPTIDYGWTADTTEDLAHLSRLLDWLHKRDRSIITLAPTGDRL